MKRCFHWEANFCGTDSIISKELIVFFETFRLLYSLNLVYIIQYFEICRIVQVGYLCHPSHPSLGDLFYHHIVSCSIAYF